jgi:hypothetical protein
MNNGSEIIIQMMLPIRSIHLFITLHQAPRAVFFISITGILFKRDTVVLLFVTSKPLVIYL